MTQVEIKKRRFTGRKVRSGCTTCKIRRVKCDEARPSCQRCTSTGRKCDGYAQDFLPAIQSFSLGEDPKLDIVRRITTISGTAEERRGFNFFLTQTAAELSGYFSSGFWEHFILQASVAEPSLKHAVIAIGSLHESFSRNQDILQSDSSTSDNNFATIQYSKAIGHLRRSLSTGNEVPIVALLSCILYVCFDSLRGHMHSAIVHLQSGLKILRDYGQGTESDKHIIETCIAPLFMRLSLQSILYFDTQRARERHELSYSLLNVSLKDTEIPEVFENLEDARLELNRTADGLFRMFYMCDGEKSMQDQPPESYILFSTYTAHLEQWNKGFEAFLAIDYAKLTSMQVRGAALLKIHYTTCKIMTMVLPSLDDPRPSGIVLNDPIRFRQFEDDFQTVVTLSRSLIAAAEADLKSGKAPLNFSTDLGLVAPLYYTCVKCQLPKIRQEAMGLLERLPRKEGMWDDSSCVKLVKEFWKMEERHRMMIMNDPSLECHLPLNAILDLEMRDGLRWEWKWKGPEPEPERLAEFLPEVISKRTSTDPSLHHPDALQSSIWETLSIARNK